MYDMKSGGITGCWDYIIASRDTLPLPEQLWICLEQIHDQVENILLNVPDHTFHATLSCLGNTMVHILLDNAGLGSYVKCCTITTNVQEIL